MSSPSIIIDLDSDLLHPLSPQSDTFSYIRFYVHGALDPMIPEQLKRYGAEERSYLSFNTTHMIAGPGADKLSIDEAQEIFSVPVVRPEWAALSLKLGHVLKVDGFELQQQPLFHGLTFATSGIRGEDLKRLWGLITYHGGQFRKDLTTTCSHLISNGDGRKRTLTIARQRGLKIVSSDFITECVKERNLLDEEKFDPQHLIAGTSAPPDHLPSPATEWYSCLENSSDNEDSSPKGSKPRQQKILPINLTKCESYERLGHGELSYREVIALYFPSVAYSQND